MTIIFCKFSSLISEINRQTFLVNQVLRKMQCVTLNNYRTHELNIFKISNDFFLKYIKFSVFKSQLSSLKPLEIKEQDKAYRSKVRLQEFHRVLDNQ